MISKTDIENMRTDIMKMELIGFQHPDSSRYSVANKIIAWHENRVKGELDSFLQFLLKEGYCDSDVYTELPTAIDQYLNLTS